MMQELNYIRFGDYYIPDIRLPEETRPIDLPKQFQIRCWDDAGDHGRLNKDKDLYPLGYKSLFTSAQPVQKHISSSSKYCKSPVF